MPRKLRRAKGRVAPVSAHILRFWESGKYPEGDPIAFFDIFCMSDADWDAAAAAAWEPFIAAWIVEHPGTRPRAWWTSDAPRTPLQGRAAGERGPQRLRLGGVGTPRYEVLNVAPNFAFGIPASWVTAFDEDYYNGRMRDVHGQRIGTEYHDGDFEGLAPRRDDPPRFESQAAFLDRHGLLTDAERRRLPADAFEPETVILDDGDYKTDEGRP